MPMTLLRQDVLQELMETARHCPPGDLVEVGVYQGGSAAGLGEVAKEQGRRLFLFDTFAGIPYCDPTIDAHRVGDFSDTSLEGVQAAIPHAICIKGIFPGTLTDDVGPIALAHVDCDQFQSVMDCCLHLSPRMVTGGIMVFDDVDVLPGAKLAVSKVFGDRIKISAQGKARVYF
jgi:hypothetical protein